MHQRKQTTCFIDFTKEVPIDHHLHNNFSLQVAVSSKIYQARTCKKTGDQRTWGCHWLLTSLNLGCLGQVC